MKKFVLGFVAGYMTKEFIIAYRMGVIHRGIDLVKDGKGAGMSFEEVFTYINEGRMPSRFYEDK
jgi:hypothetical protein